MTFSLTLEGKQLSSSFGSEAIGERLSKCGADGTMRFGVTKSGKKKGRSVGLEPCDSGRTERREFRTFRV